MFARPDVENDGWFWIDRGSDGRADHFVPCSPCQELLGGLDQASGWHPADLCPDCGSRLEIESAISQVTGQRLPICTTDPNHRTLDGSLIPIWASSPVGLIDPGVEEPEDPGCRERIP